MTKFEELRETIRLRALELFARLGFATLAVFVLEYIGAPTPARAASLRTRAGWTWRNTPPDSDASRFALEVLEFLGAEGPIE